MLGLPGGHANMDKRPGWPANQAIVGGAPPRRRSGANLWLAAALGVLALGALETPGACLAYNVGTGRGYSVREIIEACRTVTGRPIVVVEAARRPGDPPELYANNRAIREALGWSPRYTDAESIVRTAWTWHARQWGIDR